MSKNIIFVLMYHRHKLFDLTNKYVFTLSISSAFPSELLGFWTLSIVQYSEKLENTIRKLDLFPSSGEEGDTYSVGSLERANLSLLTTHVRFTIAI
jgi:hypothetical protein